MKISIISNANLHKIRFVFLLVVDNTFYLNFKEFDLNYTCKMLPHIVSAFSSDNHMYLTCSGHGHPSSRLLPSTLLSSLLLLLLLLLPLFWGHHSPGTRVPRRWWSCSAAWAITHCCNEQEKNIFLKGNTIKIFGAMHYIYYINKSIVTKVDSTYLGY